MPASANLSPGTLLQLMWLASPSLPVGAFSYSEGLEAAVEHARVTDESSASSWLRDQLDLVLARSDLPVVAEAFEAWQRHDAGAIVALNTWFASTRESAEFAQQSAQTGRSLLQWLRNLDSDDAQLDTLAALQPAPLWPVTYALAALRTGSPLEPALLAFAFGWAENMVQASVRAVPLGQSAGQRILAALVGDIPAAVQAALTRRGPNRQAFTPLLAILSARHESQYSRLFRS